MFTGSEILLVITVMAEQAFKVKSPEVRIRLCFVGGFFTNQHCQCGRYHLDLDRSGSENITIRLKPVVEYGF